MIPEPLLYTRQHSRLTEGCCGRQGRRSSWTIRLVRRPGVWVPDQDARQSDVA